MTIIIKMAVQEIPPVLCFSAASGAPEGIAGELLVSVAAVGVVVHVLVGVVMVAISAGKIGKLIRNSMTHRLDASPY